MASILSFLHIFTVIACGFLALGQLTNGLSSWDQTVLRSNLHGDHQQPFEPWPHFEENQWSKSGTVPSHEQQLDEAEIRETLHNLLYAIEVMQNEYFQIWVGTWPSSIDWTAAVLGHQVSQTLKSLTSTPKELLYSSLPSTSTDTTLVENALLHENLINRYFHHTSAFYYGENAFSLRNQANDDMLWVVLGWLENIKFQNLHSNLHFTASTNQDNRFSSWHGTQFRLPAAHRARLFYDLASKGWNSTLCGGGMIWSPYLLPYKNAITNELFISASIGMYLYFPGDTIDAPFLSTSSGNTSKPTGSRSTHDPAHLSTAIEAYRWLQESEMISIPSGLYADGFHIHGYEGPQNPGTGKCDELNPMVYTYNQGVVLTGLRGLWIATNDANYLRDGHDLINNVISATGWPSTVDQSFAGLGRGGVLEEFCDAKGDCSQNGHTFKGIFFLHLAEFCQKLTPEDISLILELDKDRDGPIDGSDHLIDELNEARRRAFSQHQVQCSFYYDWIQHNAEAALVTRNENGKFGMWWGRPYPDLTADHKIIQDLVGILPEGATDYRNENQSYASQPQILRNRKDGQERLNFIQGDVNDRGRGRTVETQSGGLAVVRALYQWQITPGLKRSQMKIQ